MPEVRRHLVRITREPLDARRRALLRAAGKLPADWRTRSVRVDDFVFVDARDDQEAAVAALWTTRIKVDGGELVHAAEIDPSSGRSRALPSLPSALEGPMPAHRPIPPSEWIAMRPSEYP